MYACRILMKSMNIAISKERYECVDKKVDYVISVVLN